jgi:hypothetical protein
MRLTHDPRAQLSHPYHDNLEVRDLAEPDQDAVAHRRVRIDEHAVMVFHGRLVQLHDERL